MHIRKGAPGGLIFRRIRYHIKAVGFMELINHISFSVHKVHVHTYHSMYVHVHII